MKKYLVGIIVTSLAVCSPTFAVAPHPDLVKKLKESGEWEEFQTRLKSLGPIDNPTSNPYRFTLSPPTVSGAVPPDTMKAVVIYAYPSDRPPNHPPDGITVTRGQLDSILFISNPTGTMTDYYKEISYGQTVVTGAVFGPYPLGGTNQYYTFNNYGIPATNFTTDAIRAADSAGVDFSQFDADGDGVVDALFIVHSGPGAEETGRLTDIWSHASSIAPQQRDGKWLSDYSIEPEQQSGPIPIQIGVFCHEAGHALFGLPDLYDTNGGSQGVGFWCLMGSGNYNGGSRTPAHMSAWCKKRVGWLAPINLTVNQNNVSLPTVQFTPTVYRLWTNGTGGLEYVLLENRFRRGFDAALPGGGLLIWHVDEAAGSNEDANRYMVGLMQADGLRNLNLNNNAGDPGDPFPGTANNRNFDEFSNPNSKKNVPVQATQVAVFNVSNADSVMTANMEIAYGRPRVTAFNATLNEVSGNGNGIPDGGETVSYYYSFTNAWLATPNWNILVRCNDTAVHFADSTALISSLVGFGASTSTSPDPVTFTVSSGIDRSKLDSFFVYAWNFDSSFTYQTAYVQQIGPTQILIVDDDHGRALENYYKLSFDTVLVPTRIWNVKTNGIPAAESLALYRYVVWYSGNDSVSLLNAARIAALSGYMDGGGRLFLTGQGIAQSLWSTADSVFLRNYFHCRFTNAQSVSVYAEGVSSEPISDSVRLVLLAGDGASNQTQVDRLTFVDGRADKLFTYTSTKGDTTGPVAGVAYVDSVYRAIFLGFGFEAVNSSAPSVHSAKTRSFVLRRILDWFDSASPTGLAVPFISPAPQTFSFLAASGGALPAVQNLNIENSGGGMLAWTAAESPMVGWLSITPDTGTAVPTSIAAISINSTVLAPGIYTDTIIISSPGAFNNPQKVAVTLTLNAARGDMDQDGVLELADVVLLMDCTFLGVGNCPLSIADINCDGILTSADVVLLLIELYYSIPPPC